MAKILLVDNDPLQAYAHQALLTKHLHHVSRVHDAAAAFCLIEQPEFTTDLALVVCNHPIPGLSCLEFVSELCARAPQLKILVLGFRQDFTCRFISKMVQFAPQPADANEMLHLIDALLADPRSTAA